MVCGEGGRFACTHRQPQRHFQRPSAATDCRSISRGALTRAARNQACQVGLDPRQMHRHQRWHLRRHGIRGRLGDRQGDQGWPRAAAPCTAGKAEKSRRLTPSAPSALADTPDENASVFADAFSRLYGSPGCMVERRPSTPRCSIDDLPQRPVAVAQGEDARKRLQGLADPLDQFVAAPHKSAKEKAAPKCTA